MDEVLWRQKQIQFASRTTHDINTVAKLQNLRRSLSLLASQSPPKEPGTAAARDVLPTIRGPKMDIIHIIYRPGPDQIPQSDAEFSRPSIAARRSVGYAEMKEAIKQAPWLKEAGADVGAVVHQVQEGQITSRVPTAQPSSLQAHQVTGW